MPVAVSGYSRGTTPLATYAYNGGGLRMSKSVALTTTSFTWDRSAATPLLLDDGTSSYVYGPDGLPLEQIADAGKPAAVTWFHHDQLGSARLLSNGTGATVATAPTTPPAASPPRRAPRAPSASPGSTPPTRSGRKSGSKATASVLR